MSLMPMPSARPFHSIITSKANASTRKSRASKNRAMGLIGFIFEIGVLGCLIGGIASNAAVVGTCDMLLLNGLSGGQIGPWRADLPGITDGCVGWEKDQTNADDWLINMARACSMMALVFGCILTFFGFFNQCLCPLPCGQRLMDISGVGVQLSLALTWPMIRSSVCDENGGCRWGGGATALLLAQLFFFFASVFSRCMREPRYERRKEDKEEKRAGGDDNVDADDNA